MGLVKYLQVLGSAGHAEPGFPGEFINTAFALAKQVQQLQAMAIRQPLPSASQLFIQMVLKCSIHRLRSLARALA
jgi:hypothetical protein